MACRRRALLLALITAASAFIRPASHLRAARRIDVAAKKKRKGKSKIHVKRMCSNKHNGRSMEE